MHGAVLCDAGGAALRPAILWPDRRAWDQLERWRALPEPDRAALANPLVAGMTGPALAWLAAHEPETMDRAAVLLLPKDYLRTRLGGPPVTDRSDASATLLWDVPADTWSAPALRAARVPERLLPAVHRSDTVVGEVAAGAAAGLAGATLVTGCADTPAALLATAGPAGEVQINVGTGAQVLAAVDRAEPRAEPPTHLYADAGDGWYAMAAVQNAGLALDWVRGLFGLDWPELFAAAGRAPAGAGGVSFLPFLSGERGGIAPAGSRGAWLGMGTGTGRSELLRAAVEGVVFAIRRAVDLLGAAGRPVRLTGGGTRPALVTRLLADLLAVPVRRVDVRSASATGAALLAARGVGHQLPSTTVNSAPVRPEPATALLDAYRTWTDRLAGQVSRPGPSG
jgi:xylulokinase